MKYLVLFGVLLLVYLVWRAQRPRPPAPRQAAAPALPQDMVRCHVCAVHLPRTEALAGPGGLHYCSADHRRLGGH